MNRKDAEALVSDFEDIIIDFERSSQWWVNEEREESRRERRELREKLIKALDNNDS